MKEEIFQLIFRWAYVRVKIKSTWWKLCKSSLSDSFLSMKVRLGNENSFDEKHSLKNKKEGSYRRNITDNFLYSTRTIPWKTEKEKYRANITDNASALNFVGVVLFFGLSEIGWECQRFTQLRRTNEYIRTKISFTRISHWFIGKSSLLGRNLILESYIIRPCIFNFTRSQAKVEATRPIPPCDQFRTTLISLLQ